MHAAASFAFKGYEIDTARSAITFRFTVTFESGRVRTYTDCLYLPDVPADAWARVPEAALRPALQALLLMIGINYWCVFPTRDIRIEGFSLTRNQARFWDSMYLNGLGEFFYDMKIDFRGLITFPYDADATDPTPARITLPHRALLLNGAGKDSILSAEMLKAAAMPFDFFSFAPTPAHERVAKIAGAHTIRVTRRRDVRVRTYMSLFNVSNAYPSVSTFTFVAVLLAELLGYDSIVFSNERSADFGNFNYFGLEVNHQWCKSTEAEVMTNEYIRRYITPDVTAQSLLRAYSELEIVRRFVRYPQYLRSVTSCNTYFWLPRPLQYMRRNAYWCKTCAKCVFLFACFAAYLPKQEVVRMFGGNLFADHRLLPHFKSIMGIEGTKPLDCVGEPEEMILAMRYAERSGAYENDPAMKLFREHFTGYAFDLAEKRVLSASAE